MSHSSILRHELRPAVGRKRTGHIRTDFLHFAPPCIGQEEIREVVDTLSSGWITTGPKTRRFENEFATYVGARSALALNSCTAGLHVALVAARIGPGDEVVTSPMTFAATANVIEHVGASLVLADVEPDTLNISPAALEQALTSRTKAVIPVHYAGHPADLDPILDLAHPRGVFVIEDAAHALPARYRGRTIGSASHPTAFSFYATKNLTTGEGGMLTGAPAFLAEARSASLHGMSRDAWNRYDKGGSWYYEVTRPGFKYNMTDIQASLGLCQLQRMEAFQQRRREVVETYNAAFANDDALETPVERDDVEHAWHLYALRLNLRRLRITRNRFIDLLTARNIGTSVHFIPIHLHPYYRERYGFRPGDFPVAYANYQRLISLPLSPRLTDQDVADVVEAVLDIVRRHRR
jgi:dTDP-4-amino-4,6-dideoxygalactose transaminase